MKSCDELEDLLLDLSALYSASYNEILVGIDERDKRIHVVEEALRIIEELNYHHHDCFKVNDSCREMCPVRIAHEARMVIGVKNKSHPVSMCPECGSFKTLTVMKADEFPYWRTTLKVDIPIRECSGCKFSWTDWEAEDIKMRVIHEFLAKRVLELEAILGDKDVN